MADIAVPNDSKTGHKDNENVEKYQDFKMEIKRMWNMRNIIVIPVIVGAIGSIKKKWAEWIDKPDSHNIQLLLKTSILATARILRKYSITKDNDLNGPFVMGYDSLPWAVKAARRSGST